MKKGFTLIEVILAISILTLAVGGSFALIQQTLVAASIANSKLIASYLAQEGLEIVRNIRDNNWLNQRVNRDLSWKAGLTTGIYEGDYNDESLSLYSGEGRYLYIDNATGYYTYLASPLAGDIKTKFKRKITVTEVGDDKLDIAVQVQWSERGRNFSVEAREYLYNWYGY